MAFSVRFLFMVVFGSEVLLANQMSIHASAGRETLEKNSYAPPYQESKSAANYLRAGVRYLPLRQIPVSAGAFFDQADLTGFRGSSAGLDVRAGFMVGFVEPFVKTAYGWGSYDRRREVSGVFMLDELKAAKMSASAGIDFKLHRYLHVFGVYDWQSYKVKIVDTKYESDRFALYEEEEVSEDKFSSTVFGAGIRFLMQF